MRKIARIVITAFFLAVPALTISAQEEAQQTISDFNLSGFGEKGKKAWEISGKSADIFSDNVALKQVSGKLYGEEEDIMLTAQEGNFNKEKATVHLEKDVVITTSGGAELTTDSLDWDRKNQTISTKDPVNIKKDAIVTTAKGAVGQPDLNKINLEKDVVVQITPPDKPNEEKAGSDKMIITCDGPLEIDYQKNIAVFQNNVKVEQKDILIFSDKMDVYFIVAKSDDTTKTEQIPSVMGANLDKIVCKGNVRIVRGENVSYCEQAVYLARDKKVVLTGRPKLVIYSQGDFASAP